MKGLGFATGLSERFSPKRLFSKQEPGVAVSAFGHAAMVAAGLVAFGTTPVPFKDADEAIAVEIVSPSTLNEVTRGEKTAPAVQDTPKPRAERASEVTEQRDPGEAKRDAPAPPCLLYTSPSPRDRG